MPSLFVAHVSEEESRRTVMRSQYAAGFNRELTEIREADFSAHLKQLREHEYAPVREFANNALTLIQYFESQSRYLGSATDDTLRDDYGLISDLSNLLENTLFSNEPSESIQALQLNPVAQETLPKIAAKAREHARNQLTISVDQLTASDLTQLDRLASHPNNSIKAHAKFVRQEIARLHNEVSAVDESMCVAHIEQLRHRAKLLTAHMCRQSQKNGRRKLERVLNALEQDGTVYQWMGNFEATYTALIAPELQQEAEELLTSLQAIEQAANALKTSFQVNSGLLTFAFMEDMSKTSYQEARHRVAEHRRAYETTERVAQFYQSDIRSMLADGRNLTREILTTKRQHVMHAVTGAERTLQQEPTANPTEQASRSLFSRFVNWIREQLCSRFNKKALKQSKLTGDTPPAASVATATKAQTPSQTSSVLALSVLAQRARLTPSTTCAVEANEGNEEQKSAQAASLLQ